MKGQTLLQICVSLIACIALGLLSSIGMSGCSSNKTQPSALAEMAPGALDITDKEDIVSICYSVWHYHALDRGIYNVSKILSENIDDPKWGGLHAFHYWGEPQLGYYKPDDPSVIRTHMELLEEAGIDFIILDWTNYGSGPPQGSEKATTALLDTMLAMRREGIDTPHVVFWVRVTQQDRGVGAKFIHKTYYESGKYNELFVYYYGKPLLLVALRDEYWKSTNLGDTFTVRQMWGLQASLREEEWSFLQPYPQNVSMSNGKPEQLSVAAALQRNYMSYPSAITRQGGRTFQRQWRRAFEVRPKVVTITWWNEWIAQRFEDESGNSRFVDNYTPEASRDIEPMKNLDIDIPSEFPEGRFDKEILEEAMRKRGLHWEQMAATLGITEYEVEQMRRGIAPSDDVFEVVKKWLATKGQHGDLYYQWMKEYISAYKNHEPFPEGLLQW